MVKPYVVHFSADAFSNVVQNAMHPATIFPQRVLIQPPYTAVPQSADIYAREEEVLPASGRYMLRARFLVSRPVPSGDSPNLLEPEFTINVDRDENKCELVFTVAPPNPTL